MSSRFQFVDDHRGAFGVKRLCGMLEVSRSVPVSHLVAAGHDALKSWVVIEAVRLSVDGRQTERQLDGSSRGCGNWIVRSGTATIRDHAEQ